jgi:hypothetical protein
VRRLMCLAIPLVAVWLTQAGAREPSKKVKATEATCSGDFGTAVQFEESPSAAAKRALKEEKLVCVLHISGHFEDSELT